jgi:ATP-dependent HslUV protease, peptidase subunit HslV
MSDQIRSTTILSVRVGEAVALAGDGQVTLGQTVMKGTAKKVRALDGGRVLCGFAGGAADGLTLLERFEERLEESRGQVLKAAVALAKDWRTDRALRKLEALLVIVDQEHSLLLSGTGDVIEPDDGVVAIGSGAPMATAAARALLKHAPQLSAAELAREALQITSEICIYTNDAITVLELGAP